MAELDFSEYLGPTNSKNANFNSLGSHFPIDQERSLFRARFI